MARTGPNQDVNDPTTIIDLAYQYNARSIQLGDLLAQSDAQDVSVSGSPIVSPSIPLKLQDGSTQLLLGSSITYDGEFHYDKDIVFSSNILTYIGLAERFREYWESMNSVLDLLSDFDSIDETVITPVVDGSGVSIPGFGLRTHGTLGGTSYDLVSYTHFPSSSFATPDWQGSGNTNYNQLTYPELFSQLELIDVSRNGVVGDSWETNYRYDTFVDDSGSVRSSFASFTKIENFTSDDEEQYVQFYNSTALSIDIELSIDITATFSDTFSIGHASWAEIDDINVYPSPAGGNKSLLSSYLSDSDSVVGGGTRNLNATRTVSIPAGKSAFIGLRASAGVTAWTGPTGLVDITLELNGYTISSSEDVS